MKLGSKEPRLERDINLFEATIYGIGLILGAGIYALIGEVYGTTGPASWIAFLVAAGIALMTGLSYAELASTFPKSAAEFTYVKEAFPTRKAFHFTVGWVLIISGFLSTATVAIGFGGYFIGLMGGGMGQISIIIVAIMLIILLTFVNFIGIEESAKLNIVFTFIEAAGVIFIIIIGFMHFNPSVNLFEVADTTIPVAFAVLTSTSLIFFAYIGFEDIANIAEETEKPTKTIPRALMLSIVVTTILYVLLAIAISSVNAGALEGSINPFATIVDELLGIGSGMAGLIIGIIALFATANTVLIMLIVGSRMLYGMSKAGALPKIFSKVHKRTKTPWVAIIFTTLVSIGFSFISLAGEEQDIEIVARASVFSVLLIFFIINVTLLYLRKSQPELERPFKVKPNIKGLPIFPLIGAITCFMLLFTFADIGSLDYYIILIFQLIVIGIGLGFYLLQKLYKHFRKKDELSF
ncbi:MAG: amino acid permease [Candidatus Helarchaeota archaeon]|nr:amino acid permease [Candidatus Helarchaeota archaeon]